MRLVEIQNDEGDPVFVNPDHVRMVVPSQRRSTVRVYIGGGDDDYFLTSLPIAEVVAKLTAEPEGVR